MNLWNTTNAIVQKPIARESIRDIGFNTLDYDFLLLQGDLVRTDSAFSFGERITGYPKYAILNSSCDLVPGRARSAMLLQLRKTESITEIFQARFHVHATAS